MKLVGVRQAQAGLSDILDRAQRERILLTRHGRPVAILMGVEEMDLEEIVLSQDREFWNLIDARRRSTKPLVSHEKLVAQTTRELAQRKGGAVGGQAKGARSRRANQRAGRDSLHVHPKRTRSRT